MKSIAKFLAFGVFAASTTLAAHAVAINGSISGNDDNSTFNNVNSAFVAVAIANGIANVGTINFGPNGSVSSAPVGPSFTPFFTNGAAMTFYQNTQAGSAGNFFYGSSAGQTLSIPGATQTSGGVEVFSITEAGETLAFYVTSDTTQSVTGNSTSFPELVTLSGTGYFIESGATSFDTTPAAFTLAGSSVSGSTFSFGGTATATPNATPEPSGLILLGTGLVGAAGMMFRRRRAIV